MQEPILIVDDDEAFGLVVQRALTRRGFSVVLCHTLAAAQIACAQQVFFKAIVDLKIAQDSGLRVIRMLKAANPEIAIIMLTGYSSITTAVEAIKLGALNYFCKPIEIDDVLKAFADTCVPSEDLVPISAPSLERVEWEHIQKALQDCQGNISAAARLLGMHRRTLQRKLFKRPVAR
ncbi:MAG TPA: response regulator [Cellvibrionaceae bacterium]|nr:response regulator [Cellvibrionaceae bacterium]